MIEIKILGMSKECAKKYRFLNDDVKKQYAFSMLGACRKWKQMETTPSQNEWQKKLESSIQSWY